MLNLLNAEFYKLFHSRYFWGIVAFNLFLSSVLLLDSIGETSSLFFASLYNVPIQTQQWYRSRTCGCKVTDG